MRRHPGRIWIRDVSDNRLVMIGNVSINRFEAWVVGKEIAALGVFDLHANVLPDFYSDRAAIEAFIDLTNRDGGEVGPIDPVRIEGSAGGHHALAIPDDAKYIIGLLSPIFPLWIAIVGDIDNIQCMHVQFSQHGEIRGIALVDMGVGINGFESRKLT